MTAYNCWKCGRVYNSDLLSVCPKCGAPLKSGVRGVPLKEPEKIKCPKCGTEMVVAGQLGWSAVVLFCPNCEPNRKESLTK